MFRRHLIVVAAIAAAVVVAPGASAMPMRDAATQATRMHSAVRPPAFVDAAAHAAGIRAIGARLAAARASNCADQADAAHRAGNGS
jgi:hypothetical protein